jgi:hypothetical protein
MISLILDFYFRSFFNYYLYLLKLNINHKILKELKSDDIKLTDILDCVIKKDFEKENKHDKYVVLGNIVDKFLKDIFKKVGIETNIAKKVSFNDLEFFIGVDGYKDGVVYEVKKMSFIPSSYKNLPERYLIQAYTYAYFYEAKEIVFILVSDKEIEFLEIPINKEEMITYLDKLSKYIEMFKNREPNLEVCEYCPFKNRCEFYIEPRYQPVENVVVNKIYKVKTYLPAKKLYFFIKDMKGNEFLSINVKNEKIKEIIDILNLELL